MADKTRVRLKISILKPFEDLSEKETKKGVKTLIGSYTDNIPSVINALEDIGLRFTPQQMYRLKNRPITCVCTNKSITSLIDYRHVKKTLKLINDGFDFCAKIERLN